MQYSNFPVSKALTALLILTITACASSAGPKGPNRSDAARSGAQKQATFHYLKPTSLILSEFDGDSDRKITREELSAGIKNEWKMTTKEAADGQLGPIEFSHWVRMVLGTSDTQFSHLSVDTNANGTVSEDEFRAALEREFNLTDTNKDGVLVRSELVSMFEPQFRSQRRNGNANRNRQGRGEGRGEGRRRPRN